MSMDETTTEPRCHYCDAGGRTTRPRLRHTCAACDRRISKHRLYFHIPKPVTLAGLRTQARGFRLFLQAACASTAGRTPASRQRGRLFSLKLAATFWIDQWYVLESAGWRR